MHEALKMMSVIEESSLSSSDNKNVSSSYSFNGGSLFCFGKGEHGRLGLQDFLNKQCSTPTVCNKFASNNLLEISSFSSHNLCIDNEGHVYSWGKGEHGRLGTGKATIETVYVYISYKTI